MRKLFAILAISLAPAMAIGQSNEAVDTIDGQLEAFQNDDFVSAFDFASPNIQKIFRNPENFGRMVRNGFPMVWRPKEVEFLDQRLIGNDLWQRVQIEDFAGEFHYLDYQMVMINGEWRINAVQIVPTPSVSA